MKLLIISAVFFILLDLVTGQSAWSAWTGQGPITGDRQYWMDSATQCSLNNVFDVGTSTSTIYGKAAVQANPGSLTECSITLRTGIPREKRRFSVEIVSGNVNEPGVQFTMYDGSDTGSNRLFTISLGQSADRTKKYVTSGGFVTFYLKKDSPGDADFSIQMTARVIPGDITNQDECKTGNEYGCSDYGYTTPIDKETIIGIVGGIFGLIIIIIPIIIVFCYRKSKGVNKKWDEFNLRETPNTAADIHSSSASLSKSKRDPWTSQSSRAPYSEYKKSRSRYSDGDGSVFSDGTDIPPKNRPPPPPYDEYDRGHSYRDGPRGYRNGRDDRFNRNDRYDNRSDRDYRSDRNYRRRYDSEKREPSQKSYSSSSDGASFVQGRDDHPQEVFIERVIEPRVKPASKAEKQKRAKYEEDEEDPYDKIVERDSPRMKSKKEVKESAMQCEEESSEDNESNTESGEDHPSTDETDEDDIIKKKELEAKKSALYAKPNKSRKKPTEQQPPAAISQPVYPVPPGGVHMVPGQPVFFPGQPPPNGPQMFPRPVHPTQPYFNQQPHVRPIMSMSAIPPQQAMVQGYPRPPMLARLPPPVQAQRPPPPMYSTSQLPQQPPVFTHLVQRGYGRQSPSLDGSEGRIQTDESDMTANLDSGVEFMKRTTTTV